MMKFKNPNIDGTNKQRPYVTSQNFVDLFSAAQVGAGCESFEEWCKNNKIAVDKDNKVVFLAYAQDCALTLWENTLPF